MIFIREINILGKDYFIIKLSNLRLRNKWKKTLKIVLTIVLFVGIYIYLPKIIQVDYSPKWTGFGETIVVEGRLEVLLNDLMQPGWWECCELY